MEPLHITEFASERFHSKLRQNPNGHVEIGSRAGSGASTQNGTTTTQTSSSTIPSINLESSPLEGATFNIPARQRNANHENLALRPSDQKKRSLGHDLTSLRSQRRPSFSGSLGALRLRVINNTHRGPSTIDSHQEIIEERIEPHR